MSEHDVTLTVNGTDEALTEERVFRAIDAAE